MAGETQVSSVPTQVQLGYDLVADFALRNEVIFDQFTTTKSSTTHQGSGIAFHRWTELAEDVTPLNEVTDLTPVALASTTFNVTGAEYGKVTVTTAKL